MPIKELSKTIEKDLDCLKALAARNALGLRGNKGTVIDEVNQTGADTEGPDRFDATTFDSVFDRSSLLKDYAAARNFVKVNSPENGSSAEVILVMRQHEFLAALQRDYMNRKLSRIQSLGLAANRALRLSEDKSSTFEHGIRRILKLYLELAGREKV